MQSFRQRESLNEPAKQAAEFSPGCSEQSERNPGCIRRENHRARVSGRQKLTATIILAVLFVAFAGCSGRATSNSSASPPTLISSSVQVVKVSAAPVSIPVNGSAEANVTLSISPGFHINANPATFPYLITTEIQHTVDPDSGLPFMGKPIYPSPVTKKFAFAEQPLAVYEGEITIKLPLLSPKPGECYNCYLKGAHLSFPITTRIQACDQEKCYPPANIENIISINVN